MFKYSFLNVTIMKKKAMFFVFFVALIIFAVFLLFFNNSVTIKKDYLGVIYKDTDTKYAEKINIQLNGTYNKKLNSFQGKLTINNKEVYDCSFISGTSWICYIENERYSMGNAFLSENLKELAFEIKNDQLYYSLIKVKRGLETLVVSVPSQNRNEAVNLFKRLQQSSPIESK